MSGNEDLREARDLARSVCEQLQVEPNDAVLAVGMHCVLQGRQLEAHQATAGVRSACARAFVSQGDGPC